MNYKRLPLYFKEILAWIFEARLAILCFSILVLAGLTSLWIWPTEQSVRISGYMLQLLGMILAIRGILKIRIHFGQPSLKNILVAWLQRVPKWKKQTIISVGTGKMGLTGLDALLEVWSHDNPEEAIEKRFEAVLRNLNILKETQRTHSHQIKKISKDHEAFVELQKNELKQIKEEMNAELEKAHTSNILVSIVGLVWLTFGITMSTLPNEILRIIK